VVVARDKTQTFFVAGSAAAGGVVAIALIGVQAFKIGAFCKWCLLVDGCSIVAALAAAWVHYCAVRSEAYEALLTELARRRSVVVAWAAGAALVAGLPFVWGEYPVVPPLPPAIAALGVPGKVTVVAFTDFECPFCRKMAPVLHDIQDGWGDRLVIVRKMAPLSMHPGAMPAALAYVCTPDDAREEMARRLYAAPGSMLTHDGMGLLARDLHLDQARFAACLDGAAARQQVVADKALFESLDAHGLPYTFIGPRAVAGYIPETAHKFARAVMEGGDRPGLPLWWMIVGALFVAGALTVFTARAARVEAPLPMPVLR
jgi:protein-disulfide isomerase